MAVQKGKSNFAAKQGEKLKKAHESHKDDDLIMGSGGDLPEGIEGGIAQIVECKLDVYKEGDNKGEYYYYAAAIVLKPKMVGDILIEGMRTTIGPEPLCDTPKSQGKKKTFDDHYAWVLNELRKIVGEETLKSTGYDQIESLCESIKEAAPYIRFRTWKGQKQTTGAYKDKEPRVMSEWRGSIKDYQQADDTETVQDSTGETKEAAPPVEEKKAAPAKATTKASGKKPPAEPPVEVAAPEPAGDDLDLDALAEAADAGDDDSIASLVGVCQPLGINPEDPEFGDWVAVVAKIRESSGDGSAEDTGETNEEANGFLPAKKEVYYFKPTNSKTKKKAEKGIECTVIAVDEENQKVNLKNLDDGKTIYKDIPFTELASEA